MKSFLESPLELILFLTDFPIKQGRNSRKKDRVTLNSRIAIVKEFSNQCARCKKPGGSLSERDKLTMDHVVPKSLGSSNRKENLILLCGECNNKKGNDLLRWFKDLEPEIQNQLMDKIKKALSLHILLIEK